MSPSFFRYIGIDYSGAQTPDDSLTGLRVFEAVGTSAPREIHPPPGPRKYWTRRGLAHWLIFRLSRSLPTLVGIDHGFSFPMRYFEKHHLVPDWDAFLADFHAYWPTDQQNVYVNFIRNGSIGNGHERTGSARWRRLTEEVAGAKSVFHFDVPGAVATSTHAGLPWLLAIRSALPELHFWPFDGWTIAPGASAIAEVYPALWKALLPDGHFTRDQQDAYAIAAWLAHADQSGSLAKFLQPELNRDAAAIARIEGWILGILPPEAISRQPNAL